MPTVVGRGTIVLDADTTAADKAIGGTSQAANKAAKASSDAWASSFGKLSSVASAASAQIGGEFGKLGSTISSIVKPLSEVSGPLGAIGASAIGVGAAAYAMRSLAQGAQAAQQELTKLGVVTNPSSRAEIAAYTEAQGQLSIEVDKSRVALGTGFAEALGIVDTAFAGDLAYLNRWVDQLGAGRKDLTLWQDLIHKLQSDLGMDRESTHTINAIGAVNAGVQLDSVAKSTMTAAEAQNEYNAALQYQAEVVGPKLAADMNALLQGQQKSTQQDKLADDILDALAQKRITAMQSLQVLTDNLNRSQLDPAGQILANLSDQYRQISALTDQTGDRASAERAYTEASLLAANQLTHAEDEQQYAIKKSAKYWDDLSKKVRQDAGLVTETIESEARKQSKAQLKAAEGEAEAVGQAVANIAGSYADLENSIVSGYQARIDAGEHLSVAQVTQANKAINAAEEAQIAQAGITAAITAATGIATLQEAGVPAPIAIPLGIAEGAGLFAATVAGIRQHRPVNFAYNAGGDPVHTNQVTTDAADQGIATKGGSVPDSGDDHGVGMGPRNGQAPGNKGGSTDRTREGGSTLGLTPEAARVLRTVHRAGKRDFRGHR